MGLIVYYYPHTKFVTFTHIELGIFDFVTISQSEQIFIIVQNITFWVVYVKNIDFCTPEDVLSITKTNLKPLFAFVKQPCYAGATKYQISQFFPQCIINAEVNKTPLLIQCREFDLATVNRGSGVTFLRVCAS